MTEKKRIFSSAASNAMLLPRTVLKHLKEASATELKALIYISANDGCFDNSELCEQCGLTESELQAAIGFWRGAKVLQLGAVGEEIPDKPGVSKLRTMQEYDTTLLAEARTQDDDFKVICYVCEKAFEKHTLNKNDLNSLYFLYNYVGLPQELICAIIEYCVTIEKRSMQYLVKTAVGLYEENDIDSFEKFDNYISQRKTVTDSTARLRTLLGIGARTLTTNEKQYIERWFAQRQYSFELVQYAYEITVDNIGKFSFKYTDSILERWHQEGITSPEGAKAAQAEFKSKNAKESNETFDFDEFLAVASNRKL